MGAREEWTRVALERRGYEGWLTFADLANQLSTLTQAGGVYVVVRPSDQAPAFLRANAGGRFKGKDPTVDHDALEANWVESAEVVYIGKANNLRQRLRQYMRFGTGVPIGHWGGRLIWQLADSDELLVAWRETPGEVAKEVEMRMINAFRCAFSKPPFANEPNRLGG